MGTDEANALCQQLVLGALKPVATPVTATLFLQDQSPISSCSRTLKATTASSKAVETNTTVSGAAPRRDLSTVLGLSPSHQYHAYLLIGLPFLKRYIITKNVLGD